MWKISWCALLKVCELSRFWPPVCAKLWKDNQENVREERKHQQNIFSSGAEINLTLSDRWFTVQRNKNNLWETKALKLLDTCRQRNLTKPSRGWGDYKMKNWKSEEAKGTERKCSQASHSPWLPCSVRTAHAPLNSRTVSSTHQEELVQA